MAPPGAIRRKCGDSNNGWDCYTILECSTTVNTVVACAMASNATSTFDVTKLSTGNFALGNRDCH